jgi:hypothetical protein
VCLFGPQRQFEYQDFYRTGWARAGTAIYLAEAESRAEPDGGDVEDIHGDPHRRYFPVPSPLIECSRYLLPVTAVLYARA